jgi:hypothetical protein
LRRSDSWAGGDQGCREESKDGCRQHCEFVEKVEELSKVRASEFSYVAFILDRDILTRDEPGQSVVWKVKDHVISYKDLALHTSGLLFTKKFD